MTSQVSELKECKMLFITMLSYFLYLRQQAMTILWMSSSRIVYVHTGNIKFKTKQRGLGV